MATGSTFAVYLLPPAPPDGLARRLPEGPSCVRRALGATARGGPEQAEDGSWAGTGEFYRRLEATVDALQPPDLDPASLRPLLFLPRLADPEALQDYL